MWGGEGGEDAGGTPVLDCAYVSQIIVLQNCSAVAKDLKTFVHTDALLCFKEGIAI